MKIGDLVQLHSSKRRNGELAGKLAVVIAVSSNGRGVVLVEGKTRTLHKTQIGYNITNESR